ncbi:hypothetical protein J6590_003191 [Homalodisca vitripennis]|nr:hypothetical protein J6590_003191 [Homalodisca vitripennis]
MSAQFPEACIRLHSDCKSSRHNRSVDAIMSAQFPEGDLQPALGYIPTASRADTTDPFIESMSAHFSEGDLQSELGYVLTASRADTTDPFIASMSAQFPEGDLQPALGYIPTASRADTTDPLIAGRPDGPGRWIRRPPSDVGGLRFRHSQGKDEHAQKQEGLCGSELAEKLYYLMLLLDQVKYWKKAYPAILTTVCSVCRGRWSGQPFTAALILSGGWMIIFNYHCTRPATGTSGQRAEH